MLYIEVAQRYCREKGLPPIVDAVVEQEKKSKVEICVNLFNSLCFVEVAHRQIFSFFRKRTSTQSFTTAKDGTFLFCSYISLLVLSRYTVYTPVAVTPVILAFCREGGGRRNTTCRKEASEKRSRKTACRRGNIRET